MSSKNKELALAKYKWPLIAVGILAVSAIFVFFILPLFDNSANNTGSAPSPISEDIDQENPIFLRVGLVPLANCDAVLNYYQENALKEVTAWGLGGRGYQFGPLPVFEDRAIDSITTNASESPSSSGESSYSTTNIQVEGVDEADIVKTDGDYIYVLSDQALKIIDIRQQGEDNPPSIIAEVEIDFYATNMLLSLKPEGEDNLSDTLIIVSWEGRSQLRLVQVNIDDRESPEVIADFVIDGNYAGIRLSDNIIRLITTSQPLGFDWETPSGSGLRAEEKALEANKEIIRNSKLSNWVPAYRDNLMEDSKTDSLIDCSQMLVPHIFSGLNTLAITTFNASEKLEAGGWQAIGLAADGQDIYATTDHVYVTTAESLDAAPVDGSTTEPSTTLAADLKTIIHKFGTEQPTESRSEAEASRELAPIAHPVYLASGEVTGTLLNQFSMDEYQGDLRVAVTIEDFSENTQENHIKILRPKEGILEEIGTITKLGIDERIFAVRFMGPQAYIVTFRQIDPLYALDLSDPTNPKALGELKITGFSSYLHPVGENLLLGVGQEADPDGRIEGLQISLFDTSDPTDPRRVNQLLLEDILDLSETDSIDASGSSSPVEYDHRAFLFYENSSFIPYESYWSSYSPREWGNEAGILVVEVKDGALSVEHVLKAVHDKNNNQNDQVYLKPVRTIVVDDLVYGITHNGELITWRASTGELLHLISY